MWVWGEWEVGGKGGCKDTAGLKTWAACRSAPVLSSDWTQGERKRDVLHIFVCTGMVTRGGVRARVRLRQGEKGGFYRGRTSLDKKKRLSSLSQTSHRSVYTRTYKHTHTHGLVAQLSPHRNRRHTKTWSHETRLRETHRQRNVMSVTGSYTPLATRGILRSR